MIVVHLAQADGLCVIFTTPSFSPSASGRPIVVGHAVFLLILSVKMARQWTLTVGRERSNRRYQVRYEADACYLREKRSGRLYIISTCRGEKIAIFGACDALWKVRDGGDE